jgi:hypothetical protein
MAALVSACGGASAPASSPVAAPSPTAMARAEATLAPTAAATSTSTPQPAPGVTAQVVPSTLQPTRIALVYKGIEQGVTAEGFPYLGRADAPITLTDYSDFL